MIYPKVKLQTITSKIGSGSTPRGGDAVYQETGIPLIRSMNVHFDGFRSKGLVYIDELEAKSLENVKVYRGDVLFNITGASIGRVTTAPVEMEGARVNQHVCIIRPTPEAKAKFLSYFFATPEQQALINSSQTGGTRQAVTQAQLQKWEIPLPPIHEQERIVEILDQADTLRRQRAAANTQAARLLPALFRHYFGDPIRNDKCWPTKSVDELCYLVRGSSPRPQGDPRYFGGPVPRLMIQDITRDGWLVTPRIDSLTFDGAKLSRPVSAGTIVMAVSGAVGLCAQLAVDACVHDGFVAFKDLNHLEVNPMYFGQTIKLLRSSHVNKQAGAVFQNITTTDVKETRIPIPTRKLQDRFAQNLTFVDSSLNKQTTSTTQLETLFQVLLQRAFDGRLTAKWRKAHAAELLREMEFQAKS